jgi:hypothetical protein
MRGNSAANLPALYGGVDWRAERGLVDEILWDTTPLEASLAADAICMVSEVNSVGCGIAQGLALKYRIQHNNHDDARDQNKYDVIFTVGSFVMLGLPLGVAEQLIEQMGGRGGVVALRFVSNLPDLFQQFGGWFGDRMKSQ